MSMQGRLKWARWYIRQNKCSREERRQEVLKDARAAMVVESANKLNHPADCGSIQVNYHDDVAGRERAKAAMHERRTLLKAAGGSFTMEQWVGLCAEYGYRCANCKSDDPLTVDHVIPVHLGGNSDISNIQPLCGYCNSSKGTKKTDYRKK